MTGERQGILFLCMNHSITSPMAEGFARRRAPVDVKVFSAGISPTRISPLAVKAMAEVGVDISDIVCRPVDSVPLHRISKVITLDDRSAERCPTLLGQVSVFHWPIGSESDMGDEEEILDYIRRVRDRVAGRVETLFDADRAGD